jgi:Uncharacterised nucleotidyltransferase/Coenzyme PQQ synthesis protein D (PqqD)
VGVPLARRRGMFTGSCGGHAVVFDRTQDAVWSLDPATALLWQCCDGRTSLDKLVEAVRTKADPQADIGVVREALRQLAEAGLLEGRRRPPALLSRSSIRRSSALRRGLVWPNAERSAHELRGAGVDESESALDIAGRVLRVDVFAVELVAGLTAEGIRAVVLKGPAIGRWLYDERAPRPYGDVDLLVAPADFAATEVVLGRLGFVSWYDGPAPDGVVHHADEWAQGFGLRRVGVDLHRRLPGIGAGPDVLWRVITAETDTLPVGDGELEIPAESMRALIVALHAAHHGRGEAKPMEDLRRALERLPLGVWSDAAELARELDAERGLGDGLMLMPPRGREVARRLRLEAAPASAPALADADPLPRPTAGGFARLAAAKGLRAKLTLLLRELFPSPGFMRHWSPQTQLARRGRMGLAAAYVWRPAWLILRGVPGFRYWRANLRTRT